MAADHYSSEDTFFNYQENVNLTSPKTKRSSWKSCRPIILCILLFELCERLTFYSLTANLIPFSQKYLGMDNVTALSFSVIFTGCIYLICLFCGWVTDSILGKFRGIWFAGIIYFGGVVLVTLVTFEFEKYFDKSVELTKVEKQVFSGIGLVLIAIGTGGIKTTVGPFGAEQIKNRDENLTRLFFIWFYWFINLGGAIGFIFVTYVQQNIDFFTGFLIPLCSLFVALLVFIIPKNYYKNKYKTVSNPLYVFMKIIWESFRRKSSSLYKYENLMDYARLSNGGSYEEKTINDLIKVKRIIPVLLTFIPFFIAYVQMQSTYFMQGEHLFLNISTFVIPVASLNVVNTIVVILVIPILAIVVYPLIIRCFGKPPTPLQRIGFGLFLSGLSVLVAGILEILRKQDMEQNGTVTQIIFKDSFNVSRISVLSQIPQFFFVAAGEVFASATGLEFAYSQAPVSQQGLITGLFYVMMGLGGFISSLLIVLVNVNANHPWVPNDIDAGKYEYFFFLLAGIIFLDVIVFIFIARSYKYVNSDDEKPFVVKYQNRYLEDSVNITG